MNLRELKYVLLGEDKLSNKLRGVTGASKGTTDALGAQSQRLSRLRNDFENAANEIPGFNQALSLATNPILLGTAAFGGLAMVIWDATNEAAKFNATFRELQNLNLDKSDFQRGQLKGLVKNVAFDKGFDVHKTSKAFYDVQSVTGLYGGRVAKMVESQGEFANVMRADFNSWIEGTAKAMANFGFGAEALDDFNRSAYATVLVGSITFDQLAKVQSVYAGAAASAGQTFDSANKALALFTMRTKSADEAATLTKSLFNDLTKQASIDALKNVGISLYDADGKIKQVDKLMLDLNQRFAELGGQDSKVINLKNQFKGSDGFIAMIQAATDQSGGLHRTLKNFDGAKVDFEVALKLAEMDVDYINEQLQEQIRTLKIEIGEQFIPIKLGWYEFLKSELIGNKMIFSGKQMGSADGASDAIKAYDAFMYDATKGSLDSFLLEQQKLRDQMSYAYEMKNIYEKSPNKHRPIAGREIRYNIGYWESMIKTLSDIERQGVASRASGVPIEIPEHRRPEQTPEPTPDLTPDPMAKGLTGVAGGGNAIRNITVNITKLIESQNINTKNITEGQADIQRLVEEALIRAVAGTEQMLAS